MFFWFLEVLRQNAPYHTLLKLYCVPKWRVWHRLISSQELSEKVSKLAGFSGIRTLDPWFRAKKGKKVVTRSTNVAIQSDSEKVLLSLVWLNWTVSVNVNATKVHFCNWKLQKSNFLEILPVNFNSYCYYHLSLS